MMRSSSRAPHKDEITNNTSFFSLPGLLVGFVKLMAEPDWARSPTSPLDCRLFSAFSSHFAQSPRSPGTSDAPRKSWDCDPVGLGLVYSLSDGATSCGRVLLGSPENRSVLLGSQTQVTIPSAKTRLDRLLAKGPATSPKSLPKNYMISSHSRIESPCFDAGGCAASLSASDIEQSEDYTCIISRGANPRTTRMFGDCVLGSCSGDVSRFGGNQQGMDGKGCLWMIECSEDPSPVGFPGEDFLRVCFSCKKKLDGKDIYVYRSAFIRDDSHFLVESVSTTGEILPLKSGKEEEGSERRMKKKKKMSKRNLPPSRGSRLAGQTTRHKAHPRPISVLLISRCAKKPVCGEERGVERAREASAERGRGSNPNQAAGRWTAELRSSLSSIEIRKLCRAPNRRVTTR